MQLDSKLVEEIGHIWKSAQAKAYTLVNRAMIDAYWMIGERIVLEEQKGASRAEYGAFLMKALALELTTQLGKGLDERDLRRMRQFYQYFPDRHVIRPELTWTHYRMILRLDSAEARAYYMQEAADQGWATRDLERNIGSFYFERIIANQLPETRADQSPLERTTPISPNDLVKDPYILEFLGSDMPPGYSEQDLETAILSKLQHFLLELGKGFAFVGRQVSVKTDTRQYYIDLVFYNYLLRNFIIVDLKIGALTHQDIGQMDMYVRMWEDLRKVPGDNPTIGIILCTDKDETLVKYSVLEENRHLFASRYRLVLPSEEELSRQVENEKGLLRQSKQTDAD